nr:cytochrome P450 lanosterol 14 alpha-demethylase [Pyrenophora teres f. maculata]WOX02712.1 cytochrome P450 lanosterol 14 alpha-demethylase [Pyrenophora teres f. maculata]WOX02715.1 cytochrome P450 lanosterol 14 alpha-demethylase [Pyrenophora teres f. maculata]WOX02716.1 cytochrome P450 lanosterol 14 alpha-demethylase [Pyrenophora teres f. maculata]WOX02717.1 cytochrome P450 lanosterol 14 alpha-demethylase [Pyrenophora teres f. maculata]
MLSLLFLLFGLLALCIAYIFANIIRQLLLPNTKEPPIVFHWFPWLGSAITYGKDPYKFLFAAKAKHGDVFTFVLLGRNVTAHLGVAGNDFVFNGKETHVNAEEIYGPLCNPVFGEGVVYDCPNSKLMEQKKFVKFGLTTDALKAHVRLIEQEVVDYIKTSREFKGQSGTINVPPVMAQITIFTAAIALQGPEVRSKLTNEFASLYHDLDGGFSPINFVLPRAPFPHNIKRDRAQLKMRKIYETIIAERRAGKIPPTTDMISHLMQCAYKDGHPIPDLEIANMMITILMAGQHNSSNIASWIMLHLANEPQLCEELYQEQLDQLADEHGNLPELDLQALEKLKLHSNVVKETLRIHNAIHSIMRLVKQPLPVPSTHWTIPPGHAILASPGISANSEEYFSNPNKWSPHRWDDRVIEEDDESEMVDYGYGRMSKGTKSAYLPFGGGRHRCIGEKFAYLNLEVITAIMVRNFRLKNVNGKEDVPGTDYSTMLSRPLEPAEICWERR